MTREHEGGFASDPCPLTRSLDREDGIVGWLLVLIILGAIFAIWLVIQLLQAIF
jgi:hypothetical protein